MKDLCIKRNIENNLKIIWKKNYIKYDKLINFIFNNQISVKKYDTQTNNLF